MIGGFKVHRKIQGNGPWSSVTKALSSLAKPYEGSWGLIVRKESCRLTTPTTS
jgi:hypothetical protein